MRETLRDPIRPLAAAFGCACLAVAALAAAACDASGGAPSPTPQASTTPAPTTAATATPVPSPVLPEGAIDLASADALLTILGEDSGDFRSDIPGLATGDFNGDGFHDVLAGARFADGPDNSRQDAGEAYVVFGAAQLPATVDLAAGQQALTVYGASEGSDLGFSVAAGDVNGDGVDDVLVGAPGAPGGGVNNGEAYVVYGHAALGGVVDTARGQQDVTIDGPGSSSLFGDSLAVGDVNGDGTDDIIIGATFASDVAGQAAGVGGVYVVFGSPQLPAAIQTTQGQQGAVIFGAEEFDELGDTVVTGDVNGDGTADIIATAEAADGPDNNRPVAAEVHIVYGSPRLDGALRVRDGDQDVTVYGAEAHDTLGFNLGSADLDGDGFDDVIMTARLADGPDNQREQAGETYLLYGSPDLPAGVDLAAGQQDLTIFGADPSDFFGSSIAAGDVFGEGAPALILGSAFGAGPGNTRANGGEVYVLPPPPRQGTLDMATAPTRLAVFGAAAGDGLGSASAVADLNGDGRDEIVLIAATAPSPSGAPEAGRIYVISAPSAP